MGEDDLFLSREGTADPRIVARLTGVAGLADPELLARFIDGCAGTVFDFRLIGHEGRVRAIRKQLQPRLLKLKELALDALELQPKESDVGSLGEALQDIMAIDQRRARDEANRVVDALETIARCPLPDNLTDFGGGPAADEAVQRVVDAVALYCDRVGIRYTGAPRRELADNRSQHIIKTTAAKLTVSVLAVLGFQLKPARLATHMTRAKAKEKL
jgi:hypothetical protein